MGETLAELLTRVADLAYESDSRILKALATELEALEIYCLEDLKAACKDDLP